jgi:hypothetical protein
MEKLCFTVRTPNAWGSDLFELRSPMCRFQGFGHIPFCLDLNRIVIFLVLSEVAV